MDKYKSKHSFLPSGTDILATATALDWGAMQRVYVYLVGIGQSPISYR